MMGTETYPVFEIQDLADRVLDGKTVRVRGGALAFRIEVAVSQAGQSVSAKRTRDGLYILSLDDDPTTH